MISINPEFAARVACQKAYYTRETDVFSAPEWGTLSRANYLKAREVMADEICRNSVITKLITAVQQLSGILLAESVESPAVSLVQIEVNIWPHRYTEEEANTMVAAIATRLGGVFSVRLVSYSPEMLSTSHVVSNYLCMFMYDPTAWINKNINDIKLFRLKHMTIYTPRINHGRELTKEERERINKQGMDLCSFTKELFSPFLTLEYLPAAMFSSLNPENKDEYLNLS